VVETKRAAIFRTPKNGVFVGSETISDSGTPGELLVGNKVSEVCPLVTHVSMGEELS